MQAPLQTGGGGRVPSPLEKRFFLTNSVRRVVSLDAALPARYAYPLLANGSVCALVGPSGDMPQIAHTCLMPQITRAAGVFAIAVQKMFLREDRDGSLVVAGAVPDAWRDYAFRLPAPGGRMVERRVENGNVL